MRIKRVFLFLKTIILTICEVTGCSGILAFFISLFCNGVFCAANNMSFISGAERYIDVCGELFLHYGLGGIYMLLCTIYEICCPKSLLHEFLHAFLEALLEV